MAKRMAVPFRYLKKYTIFLGTKPERLYGVLGLADPFEKMFARPDGWPHWRERGPWANASALSDLLTTWIL